jgi:threonine dehydratase
LGELTFALIRRFVDDFITVSENDIAEAVRFCCTRLKLVVEPSGALPVAALLSHDLSRYNRIGCVISGGNIDTTTAAHLFVNNDGGRDRPQN